MTKESLQRGLSIQDELGFLSNQLNQLNKTDRPLLGELAHPCTRRISDEVKDIEEDTKAFAIKKIKERISKLEKEFKNL